jgi:TusA-related sulfurtransferase
MQQTKEIVLDVSNLEAPEPLLRAALALDALQEGEVLVFKHRMNPKHLFSEIKTRKLSYTIVKDEENDFVMKIYKE